MPFPESSGEGTEHPGEQSPRLASTKEAGESMVGSMAQRMQSLKDVAGLFLKLGIISFGGPAAHIALMEQETVSRRRWLSREHFLDLLATTNLVPGPNAVEMASHIGFVRAGWPGLVVGGISFTLPAGLISLAVAWVYVRLGALPEAAALFYGINPAVMAIILVATYRLGRTALKDRRAIALSLICLAAALLGANEVLVLLAAGAAGILLYAPPRLPGRPGSLHSLLAWLPLAPGLPAGLLTLSPSWLDDRLLRLGLFFLKVGSLLFGSGMVLFAFIQRDVVTRYGWLTQQQLIDAIAVGQMTPGPVLSSATFIGYLVSGLPGALVATLAVFAPSFLIVALVGPWIPRLRRAPAVQAFLRGVNAAVVALILAVAVALFRSAVVDVWTAAILLAGLVALLRFRLDTLWLVLGGAACGLARFLLAG
jgi:chromate transporter